MSKHIPVTGHPNLYRDSESGAIVNYDTIGYNQYISTLNRRESQKKEIDDMKKDILEIKNLLKQLINN